MLCFRSIHVLVEKKLVILCPSVASTLFPQSRDPFPWPHRSYLRPTRSTSFTARFHRRNLEDNFQKISPFGESTWSINTIGLASHDSKRSLKSNTFQCASDKPHLHHHGRVARLHVLSRHLGVSALMPALRLVWVD